MELNKIIIQRLVHAKVLFIMLFIFSNVQAQQITVSGTVYENETPFPGVNVTLKNTSTGTSTDFDGKFVLNGITVNSVLVFSYLGFITQEVVVRDETPISIQMEIDSQSLDEVIVVGYGTQRKSDLTAAISSITPKEIEKVPTVSTGQALQGRAPGVTVISNSGQPGSAPLIRIRGTGTINNTNPYVIIDGVPGDLNNLNPADIKNIEILKDASAAAIYGSNGANGVILVTTKTGKVGKTKISVNSSVGTRNQIRGLDVLNSQEYATLVNEGLANSGEPLRFEPSEIPSLPTFDWGRLNLQTGFFSNHQITVSGGSEKVNYLISYGYVDEEGTLKESNFNRHNLRINNEYKVFKNVKIGHRITFTRSNQNTRRSFGAFLRDQSAINGWAWEPYLPFFDENGGFTAPENRTASHPLAEIQFDTNGVIRRGFGINAYANIKFLKNFTFVTTYSPGFSTREIWDLDEANGTTFAENGGIEIQQRELNTTSDRFIGYTFFNTLSYDNDFGKHSIGLLIGHEQQESESFLLNSRSTGISDLITNPVPSNGENNIANGDRIPTAQLSFFSKLSYNFDNRYLLSASIRRDGSSVFGEDKRFGTFPAASVAWNVHNESFLKNVSAINRFKFRAGYGEVGNRNIGTFGFLPRIFVGPTEGVDVVFGDERASGAATRALANPSLQWERSISTNFGVDLGLFNQFTLTVDYFNKDTDSAILRIAPPTQTSGLTEPTLFNIAEINNKGWEFSLGYNKKFGELGFGATFYMDMIDNKVVSLDRDDRIIRSAQSGILRNFAVTRPGFPISYFEGLQTNGLYQTQSEVDQGPLNPGDEATGISSNRPGDIRYVDQNNDGVINDEDRVQIGSPHPDFTYSLNLSLDYKNFDLSLFLQGVQGNEIFNGFAQFFESELSSNFTRSALDRWTGPGTSNTVPRLSRLRTAQLGYTFPKELMNKYKISNLRLYLTGQNLVTWDSYEAGLDPELGTTFFNDGSGPNNRTFGLDRGVYPQPRTFLFGINVTL